MVLTGVTAVVGLMYLAASAISQQLDPINNMCARWDHQSVVKNNVLYIDGGTEIFTDVINNTGTNNITQVGNITTGDNNYLIAVDLSTSWDWQTNISEKALVKAANPSTGVAPPILVDGALYHGTEDDNNIYLWGGTTSNLNTSFPGFQQPTLAANSLWGYNINSKEWTQFDVFKGSTISRPSSGTSTEARDQGLAFYFNGEIDSGSSQETEGLGTTAKVALEGMIVINTNNQTARNVSTYGVSGDLPRTRGLLQYIIGISSNGILVQIGGNQKRVTDNVDRDVGDLIPMGQIDIFDVSSLYHSSTPNGSWYKQTATGDVPAGRIDACITLVSSTDGSSHNLYVYGGRGANNTFFDDLYVLSLPSFTWTKLWEGSSPRFGHSCHRLGSRLMLSVGGVSSTNYTTEPCDSQIKGVEVLDMSTVTWGSVYNSSAPSYTVPPAVVANVGGTIKGGATKKAPTGGFTQVGLATIFGGAAVNSSNTTTSIPSPKNKTGAIAGGVVGGVAFLTLAATAIWLFRRYVHVLTKGRPLPASEMEGQGRIMAEIPGKDASWELPSQSKPVELESPMSEEVKRAEMESPEWERREYM